MVALIREERLLLYIVRQSTLPNGLLPALDTHWYIQAQAFYMPTHLHVPCGQPNTTILHLPPQLVRATSPSRYAPCHATMHLGKIDPRPSPKVTADCVAASIDPLDYCREPRRGDNFGALLQSWSVFCFYLYIQE